MIQFLKSAPAARRILTTKQSLFKRQLRIVSPMKSSTKNDTKNYSTKEKINGDVRDIEVIENLILNEGK